MLPNKGCAQKTAITRAIQEVFLPIVTSFFSDGWVFAKDLYTSIVKMVLILLVMDAKDEIIAATKAAKVKPKSP
jgi:hypothetical protein